MEWAYDGGKRDKWKILKQISQGGCNLLGQVGDVNWEDIHCYYY
jgi:hypothetical protein